MTVLDIITQKPRRPSHPPESIFEAQNENGEKMLLCMESLTFKPAMDSLLAKHPNLFEWTVTKEHFTQQELDARKS